MKIVKYPHPALRHKSRPLTMIDNQVRLQAAQMLELMYEAKGLGLAANQIAWPFQLLVMNDLADPEMKGPDAGLHNPGRLERKGSIGGQEGLPGLPRLVQEGPRAKSVKVQAYN